MIFDKSILIVEDDENMRQAIKESITSLNIAEVETAINGKDGYEKATSKIYDLIISDMRMPEIDGVTMLNMLKVSGITTPVCFMTAYGTVSGAVEALKAGAYDYIMKPFSIETIEALLMRTFELKSLGKLNISTPDKDTVYKSAYMAHILAIGKDIAQSEATVLITGSSGTGKEVLARYIHRNSSRAMKPFIAVNCAAIPENLMESEFFGYEKGAFTGALNRKLGKFELANGGTLLLDEIGEIPIHLQPKLLRALQEKEIERLGGERSYKVDIRVIATTNRDLRQMSIEGKFREDLYYRLNVVNIELPDLKDRKEDISELTKYFLNKYCSINNKAPKSFSDEALRVIEDYDWPGNIRELEHTVERAVILSKNSIISAKELFLHGITVDSFKCNNLVDDSVSNDIGHKKEDFVNDNLEKIDNKANFIINAGSTIADMEKELILSTLAKVNNNKTKAAELLGITVRTLRNKLNEYRELDIS